MTERKNYTMEQIIATSDVVMYMEEHKISSLSEAYEQMGVPVEMQLTAEEIAKLLNADDVTAKVDDDGLEQIRREVFEDICAL